MKTPRPIRRQVLSEIITRKRVAIVFVCYDQSAITKLLLMICCETTSAVHSSFFYTGLFYNR